MVDITFRDLFELPPRLALGPFLGQAVPLVNSALCNLYRQQPKEIAAVLGLGPLSPTSPIDVILPKLCNLPPEDVPQPTQQFQGGQCCDQYDVVVTGRIEGQPFTFPLRALSGKIGNVSTRISRAPNGVRTRTWSFMSGMDCPGTQPLRNDILGVVASEGQPFPSASAGIASVTLVNGGVECGNPAPDYETKPGEPDDYNFPITVEIGGDNYDIDVKILPGNPEPGGIVRPEINVQVGDYILNYTFEGINIGFQVPPAGTPPREPDPREPEDIPPAQPMPPLFPPGGGGGGSNPGGECPDVNLDPVLQAIANLKLEVDQVEEDVEKLLDCDRCHPQIGSDKLEVATLAGNSGGEYELEVGARWLEVVQTAYPANARTQDGGSAPKVVYSGWVSFGGERIPLSYEENAYKIPVGADRALITLYDGHEATCKVHYLKEA